MQVGGRLLQGRERQIADPVAGELPVPLGGTTTHFRTRVLREVHGWDAWNVTEDADLQASQPWTSRSTRVRKWVVVPPSGTGRCAALSSGYRVGDLPLSTLEEAPAHLHPWLRQRVRWMKGFVQTRRAPAAGRDRHPR
jgi:cellulose synthase/poly-beta-1,6-N-acetylglucosamine synthase-like glycosyltransferase